MTANTQAINKIAHFPGVILRVLVVVVLITTGSHAALAEVFIYQGPDGERMISDRPLAGYVLLTRRDTVTNAGHILADRPITDGGKATYKAHIRTASEIHMVDPALIEAIIQVESSYNPEAVSRSGATGLMQLMEGTARDLKVVDRYSPRENIHGGVKYLKALMDRFDNNLPLVIAAYNAGPSSVETYNGIPPFPETERYVKKVMLSYHEFRMLRYGEAVNPVPLFR